MSGPHRFTPRKTTLVVLPMNIPQILVPLAERLRLRQPVHVQGLGRGQAASYGAPCTNQAAEFNSRRLKEQRKAEAGAPPVLIPPIPELDQQRLISSKVSSISFSLCLSSHCGPLQCPGPPRRRHHPSKTTRRQVHLSISVWTAYTTQLILHSVSC